MVTQELSIELKAHLNKADIKVMEAELKRLGSAKWVELTANLSQLKVKLAEAKWLLLNYQKAGWGTKSVTLTANVSDLQKQVSIANRALNNFVATWETTKSRMWGIMNSLRTWFLSTFGVFSIAGALASSVRWFFNFLSSSVDIAVSFESAFAWIKKTIDATDKQFSKLSKTLKDLSTKIPVTFEELSKIWEIWGQLWIWIADIDKFVESVARISASTNLTSEEAATNFAQIANLTKTPISQINVMADSVVELGNKSTATESWILEMSNRIAGAGETAGLTNDQIFALATTLSSAWIEAEAWGSAVQKVLLKIHTAAVEWWEWLDQFAKAAWMSSEDFKQWRKTDAWGTFAKFVDWLKWYWDQGILAIEWLLWAEVRQTRTMLALTQAQFSYNDALRIAAWAEGALQKESEKRFWTNAAQLEMMNSQIANEKELIGKWLLPVKKARYSMVLWITTAISKLSQVMQWTITLWSLMSDWFKILTWTIAAIWLVIFASYIPATIAWTVATWGRVTATAALAAARAATPLWMAILAITAIAWGVYALNKVMDNSPKSASELSKSLEKVNKKIDELDKTGWRYETKLKKLQKEQKLLTDKLKLQTISAYDNRAAMKALADLNLPINDEKYIAEKKAIMAETLEAINLAKALIWLNKIQTWIWPLKSLNASNWFQSKIVNLDFLQWFNSNDAATKAKQKELDVLQKSYDNFDAIIKSMQVSDKWPRSPYPKDKTEWDTDALKKLNAELDKLLAKKKKIAEQKQDNSELFFDKIWDAIKSSTSDLEWFTKELEGINKEIADIVLEIQKLDETKQVDLAARYIEAGTELDEIKKKLLEQESSLTDSKDEVTKLWAELKKIWDEVDTTPFRLILGTELEDARTEKQKQLNKAIKEQQDIEDAINTSKETQLKLEEEIALWKSLTTQDDRDYAKSVSEESETERILREARDKLW